MNDGAQIYRDHKHDGIGGEWITQSASEFMKPIVIPRGGLAIREKGPSFPSTVHHSVDDIDTLERSRGPNRDGSVEVQWDCSLNPIAMSSSQVPASCLSSSVYDDMYGLYGMYGMYGLPPPPPPPPPPASWNTDGAGAVGPIPGDAYPTGALPNLGPLPEGADSLPRR